MAQTDALLVYGDILQLSTKGTPPLSYVPPSASVLPERSAFDTSGTAIPGLIMTPYGAGTLAWLPWDLPAIYYRHSPAAYPAFISGLIDHLLPAGRQLRTNAHPTVEITLMHQPDRKRTLVHLVNVSGHSGTAYFNPHQMQNIRLEIKGTYKRARAIKQNKRLKIRTHGNYSSILLPRLAEYEVIILE